MNKTTILGVFILTCMIMKQGREKCIHVSRECGTTEKHDDGLIAIICVIGVALVAAGSYPMSSNKPSSSSLLATVESINDHFN